MGAGRVNWLFGHADSFLGSDLGSSHLVSCSTVPQNLTSGRRSERLTPKSLVLEASGSGGWSQSLWRHLAARTLCGPPTKIRRAVPLVDTVTIVRIAPALCSLQHGALRNLALGYI